ncbi:MAG: transglutaminase domain-containing protein [Sarcina sp.]
MKNLFKFGLAFIIIIIICFLFNKHKSYNFLNKLPSLQNNILIEPQVPSSFTIYSTKATAPTSTFIQSNTYVDGTSLNAAIKSNNTIDAKATELTKNCTTNLEKAEILYQWIAYNISYDQKEDIAISNGSSLPAGEISAINTFENKKSVCAGFAELYYAMMVAEKIPVRLISGKGYGGTTWGSHMWNQIYIKSLGGWVNVDTTFASAFAKSEKTSNIPEDPYGIFINKTATYLSTTGTQWSISPSAEFGPKNFSTNHIDSDILSQWS